MARLPRLVLAGQPHLVIQRTLDRRPAYADEEDLAHLLAALRTGLTDTGTQLHAYALAPGELRLVVTPARAQALAQLMQTLGRRYVVAYNRRHGRSGTLWDGRFRACAIEAGEPLLAAMAWAEQEGSISSAAHHLGEHRDRLLTEPPAYWELGNTPFAREAAWRERLARGVGPETAQRLRRAALGGWPFGSPAFVRAIAAGGHPASPRPPGRPRKSGNVTATD